IYIEDLLRTAGFTAVRKARDAGGSWSSYRRARPSMRRQGSEEGLRVLDEASMAFRVVQEKGVKIQGWLQTVRRELWIPVAELAGRLGVMGSEVYRMEYAEGRGVIELQTLRRAAEAL